MKYTVLEKDAISFDRSLRLEAGDQVATRPHDNPLLIWLGVNEWRMIPRDKQTQNWYLPKHNFKKIWKAFIKDDIYESISKRRY